MEKIIKDLLALVQDEGLRVLTDDVIKEYITANISLLADEIKEEVNNEFCSDIWSPYC